MSTPITKHLFIPIVTYPLIVNGTSGKATEYQFRIFSRFYNGTVKVRSGSIKYKKAGAALKNAKRCSQFTKLSHVILPFSVNCASEGGNSLSSYSSFIHLLFHNCHRWRYLPCGTAA
jgi:hypothetical protein